MAEKRQGIQPSRDEGDGEIESQSSVVSVCVGCPFWQKKVVKTVNSREDEDVKVQTELRFVDDGNR